MSTLSDEAPTIRGAAEWHLVEIWIASSGSEYCQPWFDPRDRYEKAEGVMIPVRRRLVLRRSAGNRLPQHSAKSLSH